ncbi:MAG TPA: ATPase [Chloroflexi bacterium]|nr:ATPase [Chloroflexota bacterium]
MTADFSSIDQLQAALRNHQYIADRSLATSIYLALKMQRPLLLEGEAGVGKTEVGKVVAAVQQAELIRLQCYEGLDIHHAVYEWNYTRQLLSIRLHEHDRTKLTEADLFSQTFLIERPLLRSLRSPEQPVLLIDEIDRSDVEFEAFLLEILSEFQITIPEIGTIQAEHIPIVVITSNRTREIHPALKRRCIYHWIDYPTFEKELNILTTRYPQIESQLAAQITGFVQQIRQADLYKTPGVAETLDWAAALLSLNQQALSLETVESTIGVLLKYREDIESMRGEKVSQILAQME